MGGARVRPATLGDLGLLVSHRRRMWEDIGGRSRRALDEADGRYRRWARVRLKSGTMAGFVAEVGGRPVASGCLWIQESQPRPGWRGTAQGYLLSVYTEPDHRGRGLATRITREAIRWARARGVERITLHASDEGQGVYRRLGFERTHEMRLVLTGGRRPRR